MAAIFERHGRRLGSARALLEALLQRPLPAPDAAIRSAVADALMTPDGALAPGQREWPEMLRS